MGKLSRTLFQGLGQAQEGTGKLGRELRRQWRAWQIAQADQAHSATTGDRPFTGCAPCEAGRLTEVETSVANPEALSRPRGPRG